MSGFHSNRLQAALMREAVALWSSKVASAEDIDTAVQMGFGLRAMVTGPMKQGDLAGLDLHRAIMWELWPQLDSGKEPNQDVVSMVERQELGLKTGRGFFDWAGQNLEQVLRTQNEALVSMMATLKKWPSALKDSAEKDH